MSEIEQLQISLDKDGFLLRLLRELAGTLQNALGIDEASNYISIVGEAIGKQLDTQYRKALSVDRLSASQVADVMVDLKNRIDGRFFIIEQTEDRIVLGNRACPFGDLVRDRPSLCMMTSNVFGHITAENLGYAGVKLEETIAEGHPGCKVVVHLRSTAVSEPGVRSYFKQDVAPRKKPAEALHEIGQPAARRNTR